MKSIRIFPTIVMLGFANYAVFGFLAGCSLPDPGGASNQDSGRGLDSGIDAEKDAGTIQDSGTDGGSCSDSQPLCLRASCLSEVVAQRQATCARKDEFPVTMQSIQSCESSTQACSTEGLQMISATLDCVDELLIQVSDPCSVEFGGRMYNCSYRNSGPNRCGVK